MIVFWVLAAAMTAAALAFLLPPLLRRRTAAPDARVAANAAVYQEQLDELGAELQRGTLTKEEFDRASREVERRIVAEHAAGAAPEPAQHRPPRAAAIAIAVLLPLLAGLGYWRLGNPVAMDPVVVAVTGAAAQGHAVTPEQMAALVEKLAARLQQTPDDVEGWVLLGRSRTSLGQYDKAAAAYAKAVALLPQDADVLADYADVLAMAQGRSLEGEPSRLIQRALAADPNHVKALALAGSAEFDRKNYHGAVDYWERARKALPVDSPFAKSIEGSIDEARALAGEAPKQRAAAKAPPAQAAAKAEPKAPAGKGGSLSGTVSLDPAVAAKAAPGDTVFILARPASGARMPLAVTRITVAQLPYRFLLDDSMAMAAGMTISSQQQVVVVARVSKTGSPAPQKGDIEGTSAPVAPGASGLNVVLQHVVD
ncbi:MAG TPA: c-type cytochrome biogenesis protein CcmI [Burkholderiales bacterium]|nr:c-type cytochrome biogenesis protein CcmI [Burkholderiales bacterium]